ncbi:hypothetical protein CFP56_024809 [Quercus suber]|uniref:Uncharacterized protein n=1 Tax=Quercus suber TaxID=58331 RepID=A0AAW0K5U3_QUESU
MELDLPLVIPAIIPVADSTDDSNRGFGFWMASTTGNLDPYGWACAVLFANFYHGGVFGSFSGAAWSFAPCGWNLLDIARFAIPLITFACVLPYDPSTAFMHGLVLFIIGFCASWEAPATNKIVPEKSRTSIYALDRSLSYASISAPAIVGIWLRMLWL